MRTLKPEHLEDGAITFSSFRASSWRKLGREKKNWKRLPRRLDVFWKQKILEISENIVMEQVMKG